MLSFQIHARFLAVGALASFCATPVFADNITPDLQFNGYATAGVAWTHNAHGAQYLNNSLATSSPSITSNPSMDYDSVVGLQFNYRVNDATNLVTQLTADATNGDFLVKANWAYIAYKLSDEFTVRAGRFAFPTYLYSENLHVGEAYPWARLPQEIYGSLDGFYNVNGVDLLYRHPFGDWNLTVQPLLGNATLPAVQVNNLAGLTVNLSNENLTLHLGTITGTSDFSFSTSPAGQVIIAGADAGLTANGMGAAVPAVNAELVSTLDAKDDRATYSDAGLSYDDGHWFGAAEYAQLRFKGWPADYNAGYLSVGHYFGEFLPYVLYSRINDVHEQKTLDSLPPSLGPIGTMFAQANHKDQSTLALGVRYQLRQNVSLKAQVDRISNFQGTAGLFTLAPTQTTPLNTVYLYSLSLNTAF